MTAEIVWQKLRGGQWIWQRMIGEYWVWQHVMERQWGSQKMYFDWEKGTVTYNNLTCKYNKFVVPCDEAATA